jgi:hypothetical protein
MTAQTSPRYSFSFSLMVAAMVALAVAGSVWAKGTSQPMVSGNVGIDVSAMMTSTDTTALPVHHVEHPF